ncbi:XdhC family protein [Cytobacillus sp. Hz8]
MKEIYRRLEQCWQQKKTAVLATIIHVNGSAYRKSGTRCLISETGEMIGIISGGCVEEDLFEHAKEVLRTHLPIKLEYDFRWGEDDLWGLGVGCDGIISIWLESFDPIGQPMQAKRLLNEIAARLSCEKPYYFVSVIESSLKEKFPLGFYLSSYESPQYYSFMESIAKSCILKIQLDGVQLTLFVEKVEPMPHLYIIGSGPDAAMLARKANELPWKISVIDHREMTLIKHFPHIHHCLIKRTDYQSVNIPPHSYVVVMTHNLEFDYLALNYLVTLNLSYIGLLGSSRRFTKLKQMLKAGDSDIKEEGFQVIHSPVGLDIGAASPEEIIISILSEILAHKNKKLGEMPCKQKTCN